VSARIRSVAAALCLLATAPLAAQETKPAPAPAEAPAPAPAPASLPDAREILAKGVDAVGGKEALLKVKSIEMKGTVEMPALGMKGEVVARTLAPNKMLTAMTLGAAGEFRTGFDGSVGWSIDKIQGARLLEGKELAMIVREADFLKDADPLKRWDSVETKAEAVFAGFDCWKIEAKKGDDKAVLWYEKSTHLPRGLEMVLETQMGKIPMSTAFVEYKDFNGLRFPVRSEAKQAGQKIVTLYQAITLDSVDAAVFELPKEIKALLEPEPAEEEDAGASSPAPAAKP
jgi:hypothetical protein